MIKKSVSLTEETAQLLDAQTKKGKFMRNAIEKALTKNKEKMRITITIDFANTGYYTNDTLTVKTYAIGNLKEKVTPLLEAVQQLQDIITYLDP